MRGEIAVLIAAIALVAVVTWWAIETNKYHKAHLRDCDKRHGIFVQAGDGVCVDSILVRY